MRWSILVFVLSTASCTSYLGWRPLEQPTPVKPHDFVWIWSRGTVHTWQAVVFTPDSVSGIPDGMSLKCDSCRRSLPLAQVDTMRLGYHYHSVSKDLLMDGEMVGALAAAIVLDGVLCYMFDRGDPQC